MSYGTRYNTYKPAYKPSGTKTTRFSDSVDLEPTAPRWDPIGAVQSLSDDLEDVKTVLRKVCTLLRTQQERILALSRNTSDKGQDPLVQNDTSLDEAIRLCTDQAKT